MKLAEDPHRRLNPLTNEWVLVSPHRAGRPWQGQVEKLPVHKEPEYDPTCYLCPGNSRVGGVVNPRYTNTFVFDNDFAALKPSDRHDRLDFEDRGLIVAEDESGLCRVICFSPRHDLTLATMQVKDIENVIRTWTTQFRGTGCEARNQSRADLRESRLSNGRQQPSSSLSNLVDQLDSRYSRERTGSSDGISQSASVLLAV